MIPWYFALAALVIGIILGLLVPLLFDGRRSTRAVCQKCRSSVRPDLHIGAGHSPDGKWEASCPECFGAVRGRTIYEAEMRFRGREPA